MRRKGSHGAARFKVHGLDVKRKQRGNGKEAMFAETNCGKMQSPDPKIFLNPKQL